MYALNQAVRVPIYAPRKNADGDRTNYFLGFMVGVIVHMFEDPSVNVRLNNGNIVRFNVEDINP